MTEDRRVWLVVTGSYSDYQVECAAGSEADGEQIANGKGRCDPIPVKGRQRVWPWDGTRRPT